MAQPPFGEDRLYINGKLRPAKDHRVYNNINPASATVAGHAADASLEDAEQALQAAREAFDNTEWSRNHAFRYQCLRQFHQGLMNNLESLRQAAQAEVGATRCLAEGIQCDTPIEFMKDWLLDYMERFEWDRDIGCREIMGSNSRRLVWKEAVGVVAAITPWNFPIQIILAKVMPALAAGCTVVLKAAPDTPWTAALMGRIAAEFTDFPPGVFNILTASDPAEIGEFLTRDKRVDAISFTGSTAVGKHIMQNAAATVKKVFLELGGKSAHIILDDADLGSALLAGLGVCFHAGQGCAITTRMLIPRARQAEAEELLKSYFPMIQYGDPDSSDQIMGPLINEKQQQRVLAYIEQGKAEGARLLLGGGKPDLPGYYLEPTVFVDVTNDMTIAQEEIFGPVLVVIPYDDEADAIRIANDSDYGLSGSIASASTERALNVARRLRTGTVNINGGIFLGPDAPFGGYKQSGVGREMGPEGIDEYLETKTVAIPG